MKRNEANTLAQRIVKAIRIDMNDRSGMRNDRLQIDKDVWREIEKTWVELAARILAGEIK